jgi:hypothetical protein
MVREGGSNVMMPKLLTCGVLVLVSLTATAGDKKEAKPGLSGTWAKKDGQLKIEFADKRVLKIAPHGDPALIAIVCDYTVNKEGIIKAKITGFEGKEKAQKQIAERVPAGLKFSFRWMVQGGTARLDELTGDKTETLKAHMEGEFEKDR